MNVFLIAGKSGCGKSTIADAFVTYYKEKGRLAIHTECSKYLRMYAKDILNWDGVDEEFARTFLQNMGSLVREIDPNFLTNRLLQDLAVYERFADAVVIGGIRMPSEFEAIQTIYPDAKKIYVTNENISYNLTETQKQHATEVALDTYDAYDKVFANVKREEILSEVSKYIEEVEKDERN